MINVNGKPYEWTPEITFQEIYKFIGYTIKNPRVIVRVNGETIPKDKRPGFFIPDSANIEIINTLCGG